jgi:hypothetical protein
MTIYYYAQGGTSVKGIAHNESEIVDPVVAYGTGTYVIVDMTGPPPVWDDNLPGYDYPTVTNQMQADSAKYDCWYRILQKVSDNAQKNINAYIADMAANYASTGTALTAPQKADLALAVAIHQWIGRTTGAGAAGMLQACDGLVAAADMQWYLDGKWPTWDPTSAGWSAFVARF